MSFFRKSLTQEEINVFNLSVCKEMENNSKVGKRRDVEKMILNDQFSRFNRMRVFRLKNNAR